MDPEDEAEIKKGTVDYSGFSCYMSTVTSDASKVEKASGNFAMGELNHYLEASDWGWPIDPVGLCAESGNLDVGVSDAKEFKSVVHEHFKAFFRK